MKEYAGIFVLVSIGVAVGILFSSMRDAEPATTRPIVVDSENITPAPGPGEQRIALLEADLERLRNRIDELETVVAANAETDEIETGTSRSNSGTQSATTRFSPNESPPKDMMIAGLAAAGVDPYTAEDIVRRQSAVELERLDLRDAAIREGTIGNGEFRDQIQALRDQEVSIRDEIDENAYDSYLYHTGQPNRVAVNSVIMGSAAESNGIQAGDVIVRYGTQRMYNRRDLRSATTAGERDEPVSVTISRNGSEMTMTIPRGPLGVRMSTSSENPEG